VDALGIGTDLGKLRSVPWAAIVRAQAVCLRESVEVGAEGRPLGSHGMTLLPVVDGALVRERPSGALETGWGAELPVLIGTNRHEWNFWMFIADATKRDLDEDGVVQALRSRAGDRARELYALYRAELAGEGGALEPFHVLSAVETDCMFGVPALRFCQARAQAPAPTFLYEFDWCGPLFEGRMGACHSIELPFVLGLTDEGFGQVFAGGGGRARALSELMMDAWLAFARDGQPRAEALPAWPPYGRAPSSLMALREASAWIDDARRGRHAFWSALI
jgi:para-nitrobenzyl esterase